jgi:hypothetical protein
MRHLYSVALAGAMAVAATAGPAMAGPDYTLLTTIAVPTDAANVQPGGAFTSFDISYFDPVTGNDYVANRLPPVEIDCNRAGATGLVALKTLSVLLPSPATPTHRHTVIYAMRQLSPSETLASGSSSRRPSGDHPVDRAARDPQRLGGFGRSHARQQLPHRVTGMRLRSTLASRMLSSLRVLCSPPAPVSWPASTPFHQPGNVRLYSPAPMHRCQCASLKSVMLGRNTEANDRVACHDKPTPPRASDSG